MSRGAVGRGRKAARGRVDQACDVRRSVPAVERWVGWLQCHASTSARPQRRAMAALFDRRGVHRETSQARTRRTRGVARSPALLRTRTATSRHGSGSSGRRRNARERGSHDRARRERTACAAAGGGEPRGAAGFDRIQRCGGERSHRRLYREPELPPAIASRAVARNVAARAPRSGWTAEAQELLSQSATAVHVDVTLREEISCRQSLCRAVLEVAQPSTSEPCHRSPGVDRPWASRYRARDIATRSTSPVARRS